ncbi:hypothetical protein [Streptomyces sp. NPDC001828]|uniref:hypothetical protein n=1 Tax=Streptomyces sp. NPDC001828 TaxID=3364615 RepID=UPI0036CDA041
MLCTAARLAGLFAHSAATGPLAATPAGALSGTEAKDVDFAVRLNFGDKQNCSAALPHA